ncbi:MAG: hypothetical protein AB7G17_13405 [Phycisphaerales bacterium]
MRNTWFISTVGLAFGLAALTHATPLPQPEPENDIRERDEHGRVVTPDYPIITRIHEGMFRGVERLDLASVIGQITRGSSNSGADGPALTFLDDTFEGTPTNVNLSSPAGVQSTSAVYSGATTGAGALYSQARLFPNAGAVTDAVAGNSSVKLRGFNTTTNAPDGTITRLWAYNFAKSFVNPTTIDQRFVFRADTGLNAVFAHDCYVNAIESRWVSEASYVSSGFVIDRVMWGGESVSGSIPIGPTPYFYNLGPDPNSFTTGLFIPLTFPVGYTGPQTPGPEGQMRVPVQQWFRIIHETDQAGTNFIKIDYNDGNGPVEGYATIGINVGRIDRWSARHHETRQNDACYYDNMHVEGVEFILPTPPLLQCTSGQYVDDLEWLFNDQLFGQSTRWVSAQSAFAAIVLDPPAGSNNAMRQNNIFPDDRYREEMRTSLPDAFATPGSPISLCTDIKIPAGNVTVRGFSAQSVLNNTVTSRLYIGREAPPAPYTNRAYVQMNAAYNPIDPEGTTTPFDNVAIVGVDVADTGFNYPFDNAYRTVCFNVNDAAVLTVKVGTTTIYTGTAFVNAIDRAGYDSENNAFGAGNQFFLDNVVLQCLTLPNVVLPPFTLVYNDDLEWGIVGVTIGAMDDDGNTATPFRWGSAANMPIQQGAGANSTKVLRMENLFRDTDPFPPSDPNFAFFTQASSRLPNVTSSSTRGWAMSGNYMMTDGATTRLWGPGQATSNPTIFGISTRLIFSSVTQTLWYSTPNPAFSCPPVSGGPSAVNWVDSGVSLAALGVNFGSFYQLSIHKNLAGNHTFRINGRLLRDSGGAVVTPAGLIGCDPINQSVSELRKNIDIVFLSAGDDNTAVAGSILYADNIRVWALPCLGDTNDDGVVNFTDLNNVLSFFGQSGANVGGNVAPDANGDGVPDDNATNFTDLNAVLSGFGVPCI